MIFNHSKKACFCQNRRCSNFKCLLPELPLFFLLEFSTTRFRIIKKKGGGVLEQDVEEEQGDVCQWQCKSYKNYKGRVTNDNHDIYSRNCN